jgi:hypothetical protein
MDLKNLQLFIDDENLELAKEIIQAVQSRAKETIQGSFRYEKKGNANLVSISIDSKYFNHLTELLLVNGLDVVATNPETRVLVDMIKQKRQISGKIPIQTPDEKLSGNVFTADKALSDAVSKGNYKEVINIARNVSAGQGTIQSAKASIDIAVMKAVSSAVTSAGYVTGSEIKPFTDKLIDIASDPLLKAMQKTEVMNKAGEAAIALFSIKENCLKELIPLANNSSVTHYISLRATLALARTILTDKSSYKKEIEAAKKTLNSRRLQIALDIARKDFQSSDIEILNIFFNILDSMRI